MVGKQFPRDARSDLFVANSNGTYEYIYYKWRDIDQGQLKAKPLVEHREDLKMKMKDFAKLSDSLIKYIEKEKLNE
jgi:hypothetical protein